MGYTWDMFGGKFVILNQKLRVILNYQIVGEANIKRSKTFVLLKKEIILGMIKCYKYQTISHKFVFVEHLWYLQNNNDDDNTISFIIIHILVI